MTVAITDAITAVVKTVKPGWCLGTRAERGFLNTTCSNTHDGGYTTIAEAERRFNLARTEDEAFFSEWQSGLPEVSATEQIALNELRQRCLYQHSEGQLLEGTVTLLLASPLLTVAGLYDPPFRVRAEESVQLTLNDGEEDLKSRTLQCFAGFEVCSSGDW